VKPAPVGVDDYFSILASAAAATGTLAPTDLGIYNELKVSKLLYRCVLSVLKQVVGDFGPQRHRFYPINKIKK
jgi:hypothetical protein